MSSYDNDHWDWIRGLINQAETPTPQPAPRPTPAIPATPDAVDVAGGNVYAVTTLTDGLVSYQPLKGMWR